MNRRLGWLPLALVLAGLASCGDSPEPAATSAPAAVAADADTVS